MKLISLWEPWATLLATGQKRIETRSWSTDYRGPVAIHAFKAGLTNADMFSLIHQPHFKDVLNAKTVITRDTVAYWIHRKFKKGHIIAFGDLVGCLPMESIVCLPALFSEYPGTRHAARARLWQLWAR